MKVMVTGHRPSRIKGSEDKITEWFKQQLSEIDNIEECISGCCRGVDRLFTDVVIEKNLPLLCAFPLKHELNKPEQEIASHAKEIFFFSNDFYEGVYEDRDKWMVDRADIVLAVWDGFPAGGAYEAIKYAESIGKKILVLEVEHLPIPIGMPTLDGVDTEKNINDYKDYK